MRQHGKTGNVQEARRSRAAGAGDEALAQASGVFARAGFTDPGLVLRWSEIAGADVARLTQPVRFQDGPEGSVLTLRCVPGSALVLQHETRALIGRVNAYLGQQRVSRLRLVTGGLAELPRLPRHPAAGDAAPADSPPGGLQDALARLSTRRAKLRPKARHAAKPFGRGN
jgi:hypothetical protein